MPVRRGQLFSLDLAVAAAAAISVLLASLWAWDYTRETVALRHRYLDLGLLASSAGAALVESQGLPKNWSAIADAQAIGIVSSPWELDSGKLASLAAANISDVKRLLGIRGPGYGFRLKVSRWNGTGYGLAAVVGELPSNASVVVKQERFATLNQSWAFLELEVWQ